MRPFSPFRPIFIAVICLSFHSPGAAGAAKDSCEDPMLRESLKPELKLEEVEAKCGENETLPYARTRITKRNREEMSVSCCAGMRIQMYEAAEMQLESRKRQCQATTSAASILNCGSTRDCYQRNIGLMNSGMDAAGRRADLAKDAKRIGENCEQAVKAAMQRIASEENVMRNVLNSSASENRGAILASPTLRAQ